MANPSTSRLLDTSPPRRERAWVDYLWSAYSLFFFIEPVMRHNAHYWRWCLGVFVVFVVLYIGLVRSCEPRRRLVIMAAMFALGLYTFPHNAGGTTFFIYAASFLPFSLQGTTLIVTLLATQSLVIGLEAWRFRLEPVNAAIGIFFTLLVGGSNIFFAQKQRADSRLRMKQEEVEALAAVAERERIARDLHDVLGHTLSVIVLKAELAGRLLDQTASDATTNRARSEIAEVERTARTALAEVREAIVGYRARGLGAEIEAARRTLDAAGVTLTVDLPSSGPVSPALTAAEETVLALAVREAVTNIVRHARATACHLRFVQENNRRYLVVEDNGQHPATREGNGLRGMRERVEALGGHLQLQRESGTRLLIDLPLPPPGNLPQPGLTAS